MTGQDFLPLQIAESIVKGSDREVRVPKAQPRISVIDCDGLIKAIRNRMEEEDGIRATEDSMESIMTWLIEKSISQGYYPFEALEGVRYWIEPISRRELSRDQLDELFGRMVARIPQLRGKVDAVGI